ncbi:MAG: hypothetical protein WD928_09725 [Gammaproteobacteria bacterium]
MRALFARPAFATIALVLVVGLVYAPGLEGDFAFDDGHVIIDNATLDLADWRPQTLLDAAFSTATGPLLRPLSMISFALNRTWFGADPFSFKLTNVALHACNALLVLVLLRRLLPHVAPSLPAPRIALLAFAVSLAWAVHPINVGTVLYVVQRMTLLASTFMLLGLIVYLEGRMAMANGRPFPRRHAVAIMACLVLGLAAKETAILLLPFVLLIDLTLFDGGRRYGRRLAVAGGACVLVFALAAVLAPRAVYLDYGSRPYDLLERLLTQCRVLWHYLGSIVWPDPRQLALFHDDLVVSRGLFEPPSTLPALLGMATLVAVAVGRRPRWLAFGAGWFLVGHLLESTVFPLELMHEHRNYFAVLGVLLAGALGLEAWRGAAPSWRLGLGAVLVLALALLGWQRAVLWGDPLRQMAVEAHHHPGSPRSHYEFGRIAVETGSARGDAALIAQGMASIERAAQLSSSPLLPLSSLLKLAVNAADQAAIDALLTRVETQPVRRRAQVLKLVIECQVKGPCRADPATVMRLAGLALPADGAMNAARAAAVEWLAIYYLRVLGDSEAGIGMLREVVAERPGDEEQVLRLAEALAANGREAEAAGLIAGLRQSLPWHAAISARPWLRRLRAAAALAEAP